MRAIAMALVITTRHAGRAMQGGAATRRETLGGVEGLRSRAGLGWLWLSFPQRDPPAPKVAFRLDSTGQDRTGRGWLICCRLPRRQCLCLWRALQSMPAQWVSGER